MNKNNQEYIIHEYIKENREDFSKDIMERSDDELVDELIKVILKCQRNNFYMIHLYKYEVIRNPIKIYEELRENLQSKIDAKSNTNEENMYDLINMKDTKMQLVKLTYLLGIGYDQELLDVYVLLPIYVDKYYMQLSGNKYLPIYQIVESSTYNGKTRKGIPVVTQKVIFMTERIYKNKIVIQTTDKEQINCVVFSSNIFSKDVNPYKYILAKYGLTNTIRFLDLKHIYFSDYEIKNDDMYIFKKAEVYMMVPKYVYDNDNMTQSFIGSLMLEIKKKSTLQDINNIEYWQALLGKEFGIERVDEGLKVLESLESIYDISAMEAIRLPYEEKYDIYHNLRWIMREFGPLMLKDNYSLENKRVRLGEHIVAKYAVLLSTNLHRISKYGKEIDMKKLKQALDINPWYLINKLVSKNKLVNYRDSSNDDDAISALKASFKGISALGENGKNRISSKSRALHDSFINKLDLTKSSPSDPGMTRALTPTVKLYDRHFYDIDEPLTWKEEYDKMIEIYEEKMGILQIAEARVELLNEGVDSDLLRAYKEDLDGHYKLLVPVQKIFNALNNIKPAYQLDKKERRKRGLL